MIRTLVLGKIALTRSSNPRLKLPMLTSISTSPSVYVIYSTLMGIYDCDINSAPNLGPIYDEVTIAYPPDALSTGVCYHTNWRSINYTELYYPPPDYEVITQAACSMNYGDLRTVDSSGILAGSPIFSIPGGVSQLNPLWSTCTPAAPGGYDPPRALTKTGNLVPTPTPPPMTQAKPEPSATLELPAETSGASTADGANYGQTPQDPSNPDGTNFQDPGAANGGDPGSSTGKQDGKASGLDPQNPGTSSIPSVESGENPGSVPQDNGGIVGSGSVEGSKANSADPQDSGVPDSPGSASKGDPSSVSPNDDSNEGSEIGGFLREASGGGLQLGTVTIAQGAQTTHSGHIFSVGSNFVLVDGTSFDLQSTNPVTPPGLAYTGAPSQQDGSGRGVVVGTTTFLPGAQTTYSGHTMSVGSNIFAVDGTSYSEAAGGGLILGTTTLPPGAQMTRSGHVISVGSTSVVVDGTSYTWAAGASSPTSTSASDNLGGLIMSAFGTGPAANSSSSVLAFTGDAATLRVPSTPGLLTTMMTAYIMYLHIL